MILWLARFAVLLAAGTTLFFNASWAWQTADATHHRAAFVALALAIDLCKITFLGAAAQCWTRSFHLRATILLLLWPLALGASTFMAYASLTMQKGAADAIVEGRAQDRARLQARHDRTHAALATAQRVPEWAATAGCAAPRTSAQRTYCTNVKALQAALDDLSRQLGPAPTVTAQLDLTRLAQATGATLEQLAFLVALVPAVLLELLASLGSYAVGSSARSKDSQRPAERISRQWRLRPGPQSEAAPETRPGPFGAGSKSVPTSRAPASPKIPKLPAVRPAG